MKISVFKRMTSWRWLVTFIVLLPLFILIEIPRHGVQFFVIFFKVISDLLGILEDFLYHFSCRVAKKVRVAKLKKWWMKDFEKKAKPSETVDTNTNNK